MTYESTINKIKKIKEDRDKFLRLMEQRKKLHTSLPDIEELDIWRKTVLEVSKKLIKNTS